MQAFTLDSIVEFVLSAGDDTGFPSLVIDLVWGTGLALPIDELVPIFADTSIILEAGQHGANGLTHLSIVIISLPLLTELTNSINSMQSILTNILILMVDFYFL